MLLFPFDHQPRTRLICGPNTIDRVGELAVRFGGRSVLLVTARALWPRTRGHVKKTEAAGLRVTLLTRHARTHDPMR
jgi:hypothetical protein